MAEPRPADFAPEDQRIKPCPSLRSARCRLVMDVLKISPSTIANHGYRQRRQIYATLGLLKRLPEDIIQNSKTGMNTALENPAYTDQLGRKLWRKYGEYDIKFEFGSNTKSCLDIPETSGRMP